MSLFPGTLWAIFIRGIYVVFLLIHVTMTTANRQRSLGGLSPQHKTLGGGGVQVRFSIPFTFPFRCPGAHGPHSF